MSASAATSASTSASTSTATSAGTSSATARSTSTATATATATATPSPRGLGVKPRLLLLGLGVLGGLTACGYRWLGANPDTLECLLPVENLSNEVGAGQIFDKALRARLGEAGGLGAQGRKGVVSGQACLRARLLQVSQSPLTQATHFRLTAVLELSLAKEGFRPIRLAESEEFGYGADVLLTEASMRAAWVRLADKTAQKGLEQMQMQWRAAPPTAP